MKCSIESRVKAVVARHFGIPVAKLRLDDVFVGDLGADALDLIELFYALEAEFETVIPRSTADKLTTVRSVITHLRP